MMARMARRGQRIVLRLTMGAQTLPDVDSYNTVAEITGSKHPEQVGDFKYAVLISQKTPNDNTLTQVLVLQRFYNWLLTLVNTVQLVFLQD